MRIFLIMSIALLISCSKESVTFTPGEKWLDTDGNIINAHGGGMLKVGNQYYWYGESKGEGQLGYLAKEGVRCYSSSNLKDWKNEGIVLAVEEDSNSLIKKDCILERPKVIYNAKNNQYVMWFHLEPPKAGYSGALSGVAVSKSPIGPFKFIDAFRANKGSWPSNYSEEKRNLPICTTGLKFSGGDLPKHIDSINIVARDYECGQMARDMNLFVDDDGKAYHIYSSEENSTLHIALLNDDYTGHSGVYTRNFPGRFMEAPTLFKKNGKYYMIMSGCTGWRPNQSRSAVADSILGEWKELGDPCIGDSKLTTFDTQSTYILKVNINNEEKFIYMSDRWNPSDLKDSRYVWLPIDFNDGKPTISWYDKWNLR